MSDATANHGIRVLVAEGEALVAEMIETLLSEIGGAVTVRASDGSEARNRSLHAPA